ncbi:MAG: hypothetical protein GX663_09040 [Clostridiales bacterium]|nr:hypothetical protein [Clostridiales bacterium]
MKKNLLRIMGLVVILSFGFLLLAGAGKDPAEKQVITLLEKRTIIMENILSRKVTFEEGKERLKEIEKGSLYKRDVKVLSQYENSDYVKTMDMDVVSIENTGNLYDKKKYICEIQWTFLDYEGEKEETKIYDVCVEWDGSRNKLITFQMQ